MTHSAMPYPAMSFTARQTTATSAKRRRRALGQVFTPALVADFMARWACAHRPARILDPALGDGVFVKAVAALARRRRTWSPRIDAYEIDRALADGNGRDAASRPMVRVRVEDFVLARIAGRYDAIIANPPYVRHHAFEYGEAVLRRYDALAGRRLSRATNLYGLFLLRIAALLLPGGRAAIITPAEWLNADFGVALKARLLEQNLLDALVQFDPATHVFAGALTTAVIVLLRRGRRADEPVRLARVFATADLPGLDVSRAMALPCDALCPAMKWSVLFEAGPAGRRVGLSRPAAGRVAVMRRVGDVARCSRGIATGANAFFTLRESERRRWKIALADLRPCITRAAQLRGERLDAAALKRLADRDERIYLLWPRRPLRPAVRRYLAYGRLLGVHRRHLPSHRPVWYMPEQRPPAPLLIAVFSRGGFRVVWNEAGVLNLTAYHGVYPRAGDGRGEDGRSARALFEFLRSPAGQRAIVQHRRVYGGGLYKLEPRDVEAVSLPPLHRPSKPEAPASD